MPYYINNSCPICAQGMLEIVFESKALKCTISCDECSAEWNSPEDAFNHTNGFRREHHKAQVRTASLAEIDDAGWLHYIIHDE